jgi:glycosyltransferase involved in cell wall biosynthesis
MKVAAVVPAYNEEKYIGKTIQELRNCPLIESIIVVDDCSGDKTCEIASQDGVILCRHSKNKGVGAAIKTGFKKALELNADVAVIMAGDGQMPVSELPKLLQQCENGFGLVIGNRFAENDPRHFGMPTVRYYGAKILSFMTYVATGQRIADSQNGYSALTREALQRINIDALVNRWGVHNDIISRCSVAGIPIATVPQKSKFVDAEGKRIHSKVWVWNIILPNLYVFTKSLMRRILSSCGIRRY